MFHMWDMSLGMDWWWIFGGIWMFIFWGSLIAIIVWGIKKLTERGGTATRSDPLDVVKKRYASGELSREEFEQIKKDLA